MNRQKVKISQEDVKLVPHRGRVGDLRPLSNFIDVTDGDLLPPAVVRDRRSQQYVVVGGERRWRAAMRANAPLYVIICDVWPDFLAWATLDKMRENPAHPSVPLAVTDAVLLTQTLAQYLSPGRDDHMDDVIGEYLGMSPGRIGEARSLKRILDRHNNPPEIQELAEREWALVATGQASPSAAFQRVRRAEVKRVTPPANAAEQRSKINRAAGICAGLIDGLANFGDLSPDIGPDEAEDMIKRLADGRRALELVIRKLQGARS